MIMKIREFIIKYIDRIANEIKDISFRYAYDRSSDFHIVEVEPESTRRGNDDYIKLECDFHRDFYNSFPNENLLISDVDDINEMSNIIYTKTSIDNIILENNCDKEKNYGYCLISTYDPIVFSSIKNNSSTYEEMEQFFYSFAA